jgi:mRNA-degrading endonuclease YafQ of YafQ-DinJ toxin-antitoxin module
LERYKIFLDNPFNPQLNNHHLSGQLNKYRSINITGDWRALYLEGLNANGGEVIIFEILGTHSQLYK